MPRNPPSIQIPTDILPGGSLRHATEADDLLRTRHESSIKAFSEGNAGLDIGSQCVYLIEGHLYPVLQIFHANRTHYLRNKILHYSLKLDPRTTGIE